MNQSVHVLSFIAEL